MLRRLNAPPPPPFSPASSSSSYTRALSLLLSHALAWSKDAVTSARKVWVPLVLFAVVGCCHLLGYAMLVYSALAVWGPTTTPADAAAATAAATSSSIAEEAVPMMAPPQYLPGEFTLADFQSLGFVIYMASLCASFVWLQHYVRTRREELAAREEERWRGGGRMVSV